MAFLAFTSAQMDADSPWTETETQLIRTNFDDHESRIGSNEAISDGAIRDDFVGTAIDADTWDTAVAGGGTLALDGQPDHYAHLSHGAGGEALMAATTKRMRFDLDRNHSIVWETRIKLTAATDANMFWGFQDSALTLVSASITDTSDMIGFVRGTNSNSLKFRTAKASTSAETDNLGNTSAWTKLRIEIVSLSSGADITVRAYVDGTEISGSPFTDETKIPAVELKPFMASGAGGGTRESFIDYLLAYWTARPLSN